MADPPVPAGQVALALAGSDVGAMERLFLLEAVTPAYVGKYDADRDYRSLEAKRALRRRLVRKQLTRHHFRNATLVDLEMGGDLMIEQAPAFHGFDLSSHRARNRRGSLLLHDCPFLFGTRSISTCRYRPPSDSAFAKPIVRYKVE